MLLQNRMKISTYASNACWALAAVLIGVVPVVITFLLATALYYAYHKIATRNQTDEEILQQYYEVYEKDYLREMERREAADKGGKQ